jgi:hypothetical protein
MGDKYIYLIFSRTGTWLSKVISIFTEGKYTHTSISFDNNFNKLYSFGRTNPSNPLSAGFVEENLHDGVYKKFKGSICVIYRVKVTESQYTNLQHQIENFISFRKEYKYNFVGLFGVLFNKPLKRKKHYFCSQFVSEVLINSGIFNSDKLPELIKPTDLASSLDNKELVYEGLINSYYSMPVNYIALAHN